VSAAAPRSTVYQPIRLVDRPILIVAGRNYDLRIIDHCKSVHSRTHLREKWGRRYGARSLSLRIREVLRKIGADGYTTHGLRKNAGITLAENGRRVPQIMAALGHKTPKMALYYCRLAD
jgi:integrase